MKTKTEQARDRYDALLKELSYCHNLIMDEYEFPSNKRDKTKIAMMDARVDQIRDQLDQLANDFLL